MNTFTLPDKVYDFIKKILTVVLPALAGLLSTLSVIWGWDTGAVLQSIGAVALALGAILGISNVPFQRAGGGVVGDIQVVEYEDDAGSPARTALVSFEQEPSALSDGQQISLRYREKPTDISNL